MIAKRKKRPSGNSGTELHGGITYVAFTSKVDPVGAPVGSCVEPENSKV